MVIRLSRLFGVVLLCAVVLLTTCSSQINYEFSMCYQNGISHRCEPPASTSFSFMKTPYVSSTCGNPATDFCLYDGYNITDNTVVATCGFVCDADSEDNSHPPNDMTDFYPSETPRTWWQSESGVNNVTIQLPFDCLVQVQAVSFHFLSLIPDAFYILKSVDHGETYTPFHYFARDCDGQYMISPQASLTLHNETSVLCQSITDQMGQISFVVDLSRPSTDDDIAGWSDALYEFASATDIEIVLDEHHIVQNVDIDDYYYALEDFAVLAKCQCYGHANSCSSDGVCNCEHRTAGDNCERCDDLHNNIPWRISNGDAPFECEGMQCL